MMEEFGLASGKGRKFIMFDFLERGDERTSLTVYRVVLLTKNGLPYWEIHMKQYPYLY